MNVKLDTKNISVSTVTYDKLRLFSWIHYEFFKTYIIDMLKHSNLTLCTDDVAMNTSDSFTLDTTTRVVIDHTLQTTININIYNVASERATGVSDALAAIEQMAKVLEHTADVLCELGADPKEVEDADKH